MIRYKDLVEYIKVNHVNWDTELFSVLRDFFDKYTQQQIAPVPPQQTPKPDVITQQAQIAMGWKPPADGQYTNEDLLNLFST